MAPHLPRCCRRAGCYPISQRDWIVGPDPRHGTQVCVPTYIVHIAPRTGRFSGRQLPALNHRLDSLPWRATWPTDRCKPTWLKRYGWIIHLSFSPPVNPVTSYHVSFLSCTAASFPAWAGAALLPPVYSVCTVRGGMPVLLCWSLVPRHLCECDPVRSPSPATSYNCKCWLKHTAKSSADARVSMPLFTNPERQTLIHYHLPAFPSSLPASQTHSRGPTQLPTPPLSQLRRDGPTVLPIAALSGV